MLFARYGGEEFVVSINGSGLTAAEYFANQLCRQVEKAPMLTADESIYLTLSIGVATAVNSEEEALRQLLNRADQALYAAKGAGRNQVKIYAEKEAMHN